MKDRYFLLEGRYVLDSQRRLIECSKDTKIVLNSNETKLIIQLLQNQGKCVSRKRLFEFVWGKRIVVDNSLNVAIASIRRKLKQLPTFEEKITTISGEGYQWIGDVIPLNNHPFSCTNNISLVHKANLEPLIVTKGIILVICMLGLSIALFSLLSLANLL